MVILMVGHSFQNYDIVYVGFSAEYTCLYLLRTGFYPISIAYIRVFKDAYIQPRSQGPLYISRERTLVAAGHVIC